MTKKLTTFLFVFMAATTPLLAATLTVDLNGGADYTDIQSAIDATADGDTVLVKPGEYVITEQIDFNRLLATEAQRPGSRTRDRMQGTSNGSYGLLAKSEQDWSPYVP